MSVTAGMCRSVVTAEKVTANNDVEYCVVAGTNAQPMLIDYAVPR